jgi:hypothetical protein
LSQEQNDEISTGVKGAYEKFSGKSADSSW